MPQAKKFKSASGGHVSLFVGFRPTPLEVPADGTYETSDKDEIAALRAAPEVVEVKDKKGSK
jgi:hypothetical protein